MGIIKQGILGGFSGKVANVVGTSWKGRAVIKSLPISVANPKTTPQVNQRNKFTEVVKFASAILAAMIIPLMNRFAGNVSGYNRFVSLNIDLFSELGLITPADLTFGTGRLGATAINISAFQAGDEEVLFNWSTALENSFQASTDKLYCLIRNRQDGTTLFQGDTSIARSAGSAVVTIVGDVGVGDNVDVYAVFLRSDGTEVGNTNFDTVVATS